ncbi:MAG: hypothetical protein QXL51_01055 [Candidatus Aenigmatarchaeota archaeon]
MVSNYIKGRRFEYEVMRLLEKQGALCFRMAGSHSPFDIIAIFRDKILLIQCKYNTNISGKDLRELYYLKSFLPQNCLINIAYKRKNARKIDFKLI